MAFGALGIIRERICPLKERSREPVGDSVLLSWASPCPNTGESQAKPSRPLHWELKMDQRQLSSRKSQDTNGEETIRGPEKNWPADERHW